MSQRSDASGEGGSGRRRKVLLVEDSLEIAQMVVALLSAEGTFQVTVAQDGIRGARLALDPGWALLITDLNLPGKDGLDLIREVRGAKPDLPILAMTGYTRPHYFATALENGADAALSKPLERDEFLSTVRDLSARTERREQSEGPIAPAPEAPGSVLAIGAYPADIEVGCGGILLGHAGLGQSVVIAVVSGAGEDGTGAPGASVAERAAARVPAHFRIMDEVADPLGSEEGFHRVVTWLTGLVRELEPRTLYLPSIRESSAGRRAAHEAAVAAAGGDVGTLLAYQSPTASVDYRPRMFVNIGAQLDLKTELVGQYLAAVDRPELTAPTIRLNAQYWGRFARNRLVEPLEVVRGAGLR